MLFFSPIQAQDEEETPTEAAQETPAPTGTRVVLEVEAPNGEPVDSGDSFFVHVNVEDVEHLSGFGLQLTYDPERVEPIRIDNGQEEAPTPLDGTPPAGGELEPTEGDIRVEGQLGQFLEDSPRSLFCLGPSIRPGRPGLVSGVCGGVGPPVCLGGPAGVDGSGRLATVEFRSRGGEMTEIAIGEFDLILDDVAPPCDPEATEFSPIRIEHSVGPPMTVMLTGGGGPGILLIAIIAIVVVVVLGAGLGGYLLYQRRSSGTDVPQA